MNRGDYPDKLVGYFLGIRRLLGTALGKNWLKVILAIFLAK